MKIIEDVASVKYDCIRLIMNGCSSSILKSISRYFLAIDYFVVLKSSPNKCYYPLVLEGENSPCYYIEFDCNNMYLDKDEFLNLLEPYYNRSMECGRNDDHLFALDNAFYDIKFKEINGIRISSINCELSGIIDIINPTSYISWWTKYAAKSTLLIDRSKNSIDDFYRYCRVHINGDDDIYIAKTCMTTDYISYPIAIIAFSVINKEKTICTNLGLDDIEKASYIDVNWSEEFKVDGIIKHIIAIDLNGLNDTYLTALNYNPNKFIDSIFNFDDCKVESFLDLEVEL